MKKNDFDFSIPNRQSYVAILMILFKSINMVVRQIFPILIVFFVGGAKNKGDYIIWFVIAVTCLTMIYSIINFFRTYFVIQNQELILHTGVLSRKKLSIPFERIQTVNFEQNIIHQFFSVLRLKLDTAGSEKNEFEFHALEVEKAYALRDLIMEDKKSIKTSDNSANIATEKQTFTPILTLSQTEILKVGLTENHIRSGGIIFLFFFWIYQNLQEVGVDMDEYSQDLPEIQMGLIVIILLLTFFLLVSVIISLIRTLISHYGLSFLRSNTGFKVVSGLFTKKEISAFDHKIQHISWSDNLLKRLIGFKDLSLNQASSNEITLKQNIRIPGCKERHIKLVTNTLFGNTDLENITLEKIDIRYFVRSAVILTIIYLTICAGLLIFSQEENIAYITLIWLYFIGTRYLIYHKKAFGITDELLYIKGGIFGDKAELLPMYKIQALEIHQSPYQTRHALSSITIYTASGKLKIPYISLTLSQKFCDILMYKAESDKRKWM